MIIQICVGSACHLKGSEALVKLFQDAVAPYSDQVTLSGSFCTGNCNRVGVTVIVDDVTYPGVTPEQFQSFFAAHVIPALQQ